MENGEKWGDVRNFHLEKQIAFDGGLDRKQPRMISVCGLCPSVGRVAIYWHEKNPVCGSGDFGFVPFEVALNYPHGDVK